jgi:replicative DNA helicase
VLFLFRPEYYHGPTDKDGNSLEGKAEVIIAKHRESQPVYCPLRFEGSSGRFEPVGEYDWKFL